VSTDHPHFVGAVIRQVAQALLGLLLGGCNSTYGPPPAGGKPQNWGQQALAG
jgi:hypothetical protein